MKKRVGYESVDSCCVRCVDGRIFDGKKRLEEIWGAPAYLYLDATGACVY